MGTSLPQKLKIKEGTHIVLMNPPKGITKSIAPLPKGAKFIEEKKQSEFIILFVKDTKEVKKLFPSAIKILKKDGLIWTCFPKGSSGIQTDLTRDSGWEILELYNLEWKSLISLDEIWSAFCLKNSPAKLEASKASNNYQKNMAEWCDPATKTVKIPNDLAKAMVKGKVKTASGFKKSAAAR